MNKIPGLTLTIAFALLFTNNLSYSQDSTKAAKPVVVQKKYIPPAVKPAVQVPAQQAPATTQQLPAVTAPAVVDHSLRGQFAELLKKTYYYQQAPLIAYNKAITDSLNTEKRKFNEAQKRLALQNKTITELQGNITTKDQSLTESQSKLNEVSFLGIGMPKTTYNIIMWGLVLILGGALATVIYMSGSNRNEAAYRIKLYEELDEEFKAYKAKANDKEKKLARELQTERNKVDELMGKK
ncbi:hypothetical protein KXQ82_03710 [Mucilaginibacter sp. HMF5004]|uniref:hypothetical protein n=1 Tax=Mucilaginibacter rivuli TaxID=2857527 RepID=UPI001C5F29DD|nr:hypothetical protein [Mucilaginibacter rivuli]MBW4888800.1 hypothetical protein [Mucilaginibacter rivuli]